MRKDFRVKYQQIARSVGRGIHQLLVFTGKQFGKFSTAHPFAAGMILWVTWLLLAAYVFF
ncbi:MAG: hypothetical protein A3A30_04740 [Candidatus Terrybacteria bacterium RIFCSPLOWO2_01_FULL_48_14]|nr:MAG: hypothetical protein A3A30_04740 [Candidatus Terrybacteria bacterium RIFCSPLOWO2_01_FULL_48_14]